MVVEIGRKRSAEIRESQAIWKSNFLRKPEVDNFTSVGARGNSRDTNILIRQLDTRYDAAMKSIILALISILLIVPASAQFQFFEHMFGGGGQQQQQPQNAGSDSAWYQQQYEAGTKILASTISRFLLVLILTSALRQVSMPSHIILRSLPASLSLRISECRGQGRIWGWKYGVRIQGRLQRG